MGEADPRDLVTAKRLMAQFDLDEETAYRSQTCRRLATIRTRLGREHTGVLTQDDPRKRTGWVYLAGGRVRYGTIVANHGSIWPDGEHQPEPDGTVGAPYVSPPDGWTYVAGMS